MGMSLYENVSFFQREGKIIGGENAVTVCHAYVPSIRHFKIDAFLRDSQSAVPVIPQTVAVAPDRDIWKRGIVKPQRESRIPGAEIPCNEKPVGFFPFSKADYFIKRLNVSMYVRCGKICEILHCPSSVFPIL